ncbi:MAG: hypothetical protein ACI9OJ_001029 [Myxococcota bacterium]|jgi:hypothetical protein
MITQQHRITSIASLVLFLGATAFWTSTALAQTPTDPPTEATPPSGETPAETKTPPKQPAVGVTAPAYDIKLRELEEQVVGLKEKVFKSKTRLMLLKEQILHNVIAESRAIIVHNNDMGPAFTLSEVLYYLDNDKIYYQDNRDGVLDDKTEFEIFNGNVLPGNHLVSVELVYRGNGTLFSYIDGYTFKIRSSYTFYATKGRISRLKVVAYERGGITTDLEQKPYVRYEVQQFRYNRENLDKAKGGELEFGESDE